MDLKALQAANPDHWSKAAAIRALALDAVAAANSGHSGMPIGMADVATVLFQNHLKFDAANPLWPDRDRFILSAGHGSMLLYALMYLTGYEDMTLEEIKSAVDAGKIRPLNALRSNSDQNSWFGRLGQKRFPKPSRIRESCLA